MKKHLALLLLSLVLLSVLWWKTGWSELWEVCRTLQGGWLAMALLLSVPQTWLAGRRWAWVVGAYQPLGVGRATQLVLAAYALNIALPLKAGDVVKGIFLRKDLPGGDATTGLTLAVFEKLLDATALAAVLLMAAVLAPPAEPLGWFFVVASGVAVVAFALLLTPSVTSLLATASRKGDSGTGFIARLVQKFSAVGDVLQRFRSQPGRLILLAGSSMTLWLIYLIQFSLALRAAGGQLDTGFLWGRVAMATFVGLLPVSFAGVGTRDTALLYLLGPFIGKGAALALGLFATLRYVLVALAGVPFVLRLSVKPSLFWKQPADNPDSAALPSPRTERLKDILR